MNSHEQISLFDDYLNGNLSEEERKAFKDRLTNDAEFKQAFEDYQMLSGEINRGAEYGQLSKKLDAIHNDLYGGSTSFIKKPIFYIPTAVAATIVILLMVFPLNFTEQGEMADTSATEDYVYTEDVEENAEADETADLVIENADSTGVQAQMETHNVEVHPNANINYTEVAPDSKLIGNATLISRDGYFVSSALMVEQGDTLMLENQCTNESFQVVATAVDDELNLAILRYSGTEEMVFIRVPAMLDFIPYLELEEGILISRNDTTFAKHKGTLYYEQYCGIESFQFVSYSKLENARPGQPVFLNDRYMIGIATDVEGDLRTTCVAPSTVIIEFMKTTLPEINIHQATARQAGDNSVKYDPLNFVYAVQVYESN